MYLTVVHSGPLALSLALAQSVRVRVGVRDIVLRELPTQLIWFLWHNWIIYWIKAQMETERQQTEMVPRGSMCFPCSHSRSHSRRQLLGTVMPGQGRRQWPKNAIHGRADKAGRQTIIYSWKLYAYVTVKALPPLFFPPLPPLVSLLKHLAIC